MSKQNKSKKNIKLLYLLIVIVAIIAATFAVLYLTKDSDNSKDCPPSKDCPECPPSKDCSECPPSKDCPKCPPSKDCDPELECNNAASCGCSNGFDCDKWDNGRRCPGCHDTPFSCGKD